MIRSIRIVSSTPSIRVHKITIRRQAYSRVGFAGLCPRSRLKLLTGGQKPAIELSSCISISKMDNINIFSGLIRLHVLYHAARGPIFGLEMIRELRRHGYELSPGTLYPLL